MLGKLIKYEFRATRRIMLPLVAAVLLLGAMSGYSAMMLDNDGSSAIINTLSVLIVVGFAFSVFAICAMSVVVMVQRFYKNLLGSEGYLMFTLPVSVDALVWAKLIVSFVWFVVTALALFIAVNLLGLVSSTLMFDEATISRLAQGTRDFISLVGAGNIIGYIVEFIVLMFLLSCFSCLTFYLAMAIGQSFANHKVLFSILAYFALSILISFISGAVMQIFFNTGLYPSLNAWVNSMSGFEAVFAAVHILVLGIAVMYAVFAALLYFPTTTLLKKRLNLA